MKKKDINTPTLITPTDKNLALTPELDEYFEYNPTGGANKTIHQQMVFKVLLKLQKMLLHIAHQDL